MQFGYPYANDKNTLYRRIISYFVELNSNQIFDLWVYMFLIRGSALIFLWGDGIGV